MEAAGAGDVFRGVYEGSISGSHIEIDRRPYHKNCKCPLHGFGPVKCPHRKQAIISYPIRRSWSEGSLALYAAAAANAAAATNTVSPSSLLLPPPRLSRPPHPPPIPYNVSSDDLFRSNKI